MLVSSKNAGGALSVLLGASGGSPLYDANLKEIGAADADDGIFAGACFCPITDLGHDDMASEWMCGALPTISGSPVDQGLSKQLTALFVEYEDAEDFVAWIGTITSFSKRVRVFK